MSFKDFEKEIEYHEELLRTMLEYEDDKGICIVSHATLSKRLNKNQPWIAKAMKRLNSEDNCIEMIEKGKYIIHYTNIRERGTFHQIGKLLYEMITNQELYQDKQLIHKKYNVSKKTANVFRGYLALICK